MSDISTRRVSSLDDHQLESAVNVLVEAFRSGPLIISMVGGNTNLLPDLFRAIISATIVDGEAYFAEQAGDVVGVALWFGRGKNFLGSREQREAGWLKFSEKLSSLEREWPENFAPRLDALYSRSLPPSISTSESYHLACLGIHPAFQGRGIGSRLIQEAKDRAMRQGLCICLNTAVESGVAIGQSWGFQVRGAETFTSPWRDAVVTVMLWEPQL